jgi:hypothetical protein
MLGNCDFVVRCSLLKQDGTKKLACSFWWTDVLESNHMENLKLNMKAILK